MQHGFHAKNVSDENDNPTGGVVVGTGFTISWQDGPLGRGGDRKAPNGAFIEDVLQACVQRLEFFQASMFECMANLEAIANLRMALVHLDKRTKDREARNIEGTHEVTAPIREVEQELSEEGLPDESSSYDRMVRKAECTCGRKVELSFYPRPPTHKVVPLGENVTCECGIVFEAKYTLMGIEEQWSIVATYVPLDEHNLSKFETNPIWLKYQELSQALCARGGE